jgi:hypothetical protein
LTANRTIFAQTTRVAAIGCHDVSIVAALGTLHNTVPTGVRRLAHIWIFGGIANPASALRRRRTRLPDFFFAR